MDVVAFSQVSVSKALFQYTMHAQYGQIAMDSSSKLDGSRHSNMSGYYYGHYRSMRTTYLLELVEGKSSGSDQNLVHCSQPFKQD